MDAVERIVYYEEICDDAMEKVSNLQKALDQYQRILPKFNELKEYYQSPLWRKDRDDDANGVIPQNLKRGILSEDGIWNLLTDEIEVLNRLKDLDASQP
ncbi:DUF4298 domain-containing protein [Stieleria marina]|uniref:DUF4298 domain-containing protein n=1 Tax=Stieleria marina TaxID=1930275 RepID=A0A517NM18_9BACT|nr:hypothetical protein K239x_01080 [Planctomycetes bacterium K23_9]